MRDSAGELYTLIIREITCALMHLSKEHAVPPPTINHTNALRIWENTDKTPETTGVMTN